MYSKTKQLIQRCREEHREFIWLLALALAFRLFSAFLMAPGGHLYDANSMNDYVYYQKIGELSLEGYYPSIHYWVEYPPVFTWIIVGIYRLSLLLPAFNTSMFWFANLLGVFLSFVDACNIIMIYLIQLRLSDQRVAFRSAWMYALMFWPVYVIIGWFDPLPLLLMLITVYGLVTKRPLLTGISAGVGFMTKIIPAVVAVVALRAFDRPRQLVRAVVAGGLSAAVLALPFFISGPEMLLRGLQSSLTRASWETVWALLEGYFSVGIVAPLTDHFTGASVAFESHPSTLPWTFITGLMVVLCLVGIYTAGRRSPRRVVALSGLSMTLLMLFSKGFSPQFLVYLLPFVVLLMPNGYGVVLSILLTLTNILDFPFGIFVFGGQSWEFVAAIVGRTALMVVLAAVCYVFALDEVPTWVGRWWRRSAYPVCVAVIIGVIGLGWGLQVSYVGRDSQYRDLQRYLRPLASTGQGVVLSHATLASYVFPYLDGLPVYVVPSDWDKKKEQVEAELTQFLADHPQTWLLVDYTNGVDQRDYFVEDVFDSLACQSTNRWFSSFQLVGYSTSNVSSSYQWKTSDTVFDQKLRLKSYSLPDVVDDGNPFRLFLQMETDGVVNYDVNLSVQVVSSNGQILASQQKKLACEGLGASHWSVGETVLDVTDVFIPVGAVPGSYEVRVEMHRFDNGSHLQTDGNSDYLSFGQILVKRAEDQGQPDLLQQSVDVADVLSVLGYEIGETPTSRMPLSLALYEKSLTNIKDGYQLTVRLTEKSKWVAETTLPLGSSEYPATKWRNGEVVREVRTFAPLPSGTYALSVRLCDGDGIPVLSKKDSADNSLGWVTLSGEIIVIE